MSLSQQEIQRQQEVLKLFQSSSVSFPKQNDLELKNKLRAKKFKTSDSKQEKISANFLPLENNNIIPPIIGLNEQNYLCNLLLTYQNFQNFGKHFVKQEEIPNSSNLLLKASTSFPIIVKF